MPTPPKNAALLREQEAFESQLADLLNEHFGQFVVFKGLKPAGFFPTYESAYTFAVQRFGTEGGYLVTEVKRRGPESLSISYLTGALHGAR